jgi:hypothetical protein
VRFVQRECAATEDETEMHSSGQLASDTHASSEVGVDRGPQPAAQAGAGLLPSDVMDVLNLDTLGTWERGRHDRCQ